MFPKCWEHLLLLKQISWGNVNGKKLKEKVLWSQQCFVLSFPLWSFWNFWVCSIHCIVRLKQNKYIGIHNQGMDILRICHLEGNTLIYGDTFCFPFTSRWVVLRKLIWFSRFSDASPETEETVWCRKKASSSEKVEDCCSSRDYSWM